jgi:hypothetical protein
MITTTVQADMIHIGWTVTMVPSGEQREVSRIANIGGRRFLGFTDGTSAKFLPNARLTVTHA